MQLCAAVPALRTRLPSAPPPAPGSRPTLHSPDPLPGQAATLCVPAPGGSAGPKPRARPRVSPSTRGARGDATRGCGGSGGARPLCVPGSALGLPRTQEGLCRGQAGDSGDMSQRGPQQPPRTPRGTRLCTCLPPAVSKPPRRSHRGPPAGPGAQHHLCTPGAPAEPMATGNRVQGHGASPLLHPPRVSTPLATQPARRGALLPPFPSPWQQQIARLTTG